MENSKSPKSGLAIVSFILGIVSFFPFIGVLLGIIAIILGAISLSQIKKAGLGGQRLAKSGIILGILGIVFTILVISSFFYVGFVYKSEGQVKGSKMILTQDAGLLELYKKKYGKYPKTLDEARKEGSHVIGAAPYLLKSFYYKVSEDGQAYELRSLGLDGKYGTRDDILPEK